MVRKIPDYYKFQYHFSEGAIPVAIVEKALVLLLINVIQDLFRNFKPDVVLVTNSMFLAPLSAYNALLKKPVPFLTVITDLTNVHPIWFNQGAEFCLVPTQETYEQALREKFLPEKVRVTGIPVNPEILREKRTPGEIRAAFGWKPELTTALIVGSKRVRNLLRVVHVLNHSGFSFQMVIVAGGDHELYDKLKAINWHIPTHLYDYTDQIPAFLRASNLVITKAGGLIVSESMASGLPLLLVDVILGQEEGNADYVIRNGVGKLAGTPDDALEILCHWLENDGHSLVECARISYSLGRPVAAYEAADLAFWIAEQGLKRKSHHQPEKMPRLRTRLSNNNISIPEDN